MPLTSKNPLLRLNTVKPTQQAKHFLTKELSDRFFAVPLRINQNQLLLASPLIDDNGYKRSLEVALHRPVQLFHCTWTDFRQFQSSCYDDFILEPVVSENGFLDRIKGGSSVQLTNSKVNLELRGIQDFSPHFPSKKLPPPNGLDLLLPDSFLRDECVPFGWVNETLFCLSKKKLQTTLITSDYQLQVVIATSETVNKAYQQNILRGQSRIQISEQQVIDELLKRNKLNQEQGTFALQVKLLTGKSAKEVLIERQIISADDWLITYAEIIDIQALPAELIPDDFDQILQKVKTLIPDWIAHQFQVLPIVSEHDALLLGVNSIDYRVIEMIESMTHLSIEPRLMDEKELSRWISKIYPLPEPFEGPTLQPVSYKSFLIEMGYISAEQGKTLFAQKDWEEEIVKGGYLTEDEMLEAESIFTGLPSLSLDHFNFDKELIESYPITDLQKHSVLPLHENSDNVYLAVADPFNAKAFIEFEEKSKKHVWPVLVPPAILKNLIQQFGTQVNNDEQEKEITSLLDLFASEGVVVRNQIPVIKEKVSMESIALDSAIINVTGKDAVEAGQQMAKALGIKFEEIGLHEETREVIDAIGKKLIRRNYIDPVDLNAAKLITFETAQQIGALPLRFEGDRLVIAFADPIYERKQVSLELMLTTPVQPVLCSRNQLDEAIQRVLGKPNLGTSLLSAGMISRAQLNDALDYARKTNVRLGRALVFKRYLSEETLYQFLATQAKLPFFDLSNAEIDMEAAKLLDAKTERQLGILPIAVDHNQVIVGTVDPLNLNAIEYARENFTQKVKPVIITESVLESALESVYRDDYLNESVSALLERSPQDSGYHVLEKAQIVFIIAIAAIFALWASINTFSFVIIINALITAFYLIFSVYKFRLIFKAIFNNLEVPVSDEEVEALDDAELPIYTILVPVHREAEILPEIVQSLASLDYPVAKLDILILFEEDDLETIERFDEISPPKFIRKIVVPNELPKTKPKACNYGLIHARGDYVVIYDAEDEPEPDQLKKIVVAFRKTPENVACIQAKLNYFNRSQNILTKWFTVEYSMWFDLLLPGLDAERAPIPLGGTSNHFKTFALVEAGAWDPYNVTEDADLGIRLFKRGYRTRIVDSTTYEEANSQFANWIRQRSRWLKGYMQTWLVHMRHPIKLIREIGFNNFMSFQFIVGGTFFTALMNPFYWVLTSIWFLAEPEFIHRLFPGAVFYMGAACLYIGTFVFTYVNVAGAMRRGYYDMVKTAMLSPIYWAMSSIASWKGFIQLIFKPHFWEKTKHGLYVRHQTDVNNQTIEEQQP